MPITKLLMGASSILAEYGCSLSVNESLSRHLDNTYFNYSNANFIYWNGTRYIVGGSSGALAYSIDGNTWTSNRSSISSFIINNTVRLDDGCSGGGVDIILGVTTTNAPVILRSTDNGLTWSDVTTNLTSTTWSTTLPVTCTFGGGVFIIGGSSGKIATSSDGITWTATTGLSSTTWGTGTVRDIAYGNATFLAIGDACRVATSPDGVTWTAQTSNLSATTYGASTNNIAVAYGNSIFMIAGSLGKIATSPEGATWTNVTALDTTNVPTAIVYAGGTTFITGQNSNILRYTTNNGSTWNSYSVTAAVDLVWKDRRNFSRISVNEFVYANSKVIAVGAEAALSTSADGGVSWTASENLRNGTTIWGNAAPVTKILYANSIYMAVSSGGKVATSADNGVTWAYYNTLTQNTPFNVGTNTPTVYGIAYGGGTWCVVSGPGGTTTCHTSTNNGATWTSNSSLNTALSSNAPVGGVVYHGTTFVAAGSIGYMATSSNGTSWTATTGLSSTAWGASTINTLASDGTYILAGGADGKLARSTNGTSWTVLTAFTDQGAAWTTQRSMYDVAYNGSIYVGVGMNRGVATSTDAINWTFQPSIYTANLMNSGALRFVRWNGTKFIVGAESNLTYPTATSTDGITCSASNSLSSTSWGAVGVQDIQWGNNIFVAVGLSARVATSTDGVTWTYRSGLSSTAWGTQNCRKLLFDNGQFIVFGATGGIATSTDGITWTHSTSLSSTSFGATDAGDVACNTTGTYVAICSTAAEVAVSTNYGVSWTVYPTALSSTTWGTALAGDVSYVNGYFVVLGNSNGRIAYSTDGTSWTVNSSTGATGGIDWVVWNGSRYVLASANLSITDPHYWAFQSVSSGGSLSNTFTANAGLSQSLTRFPAHQAINAIQYTGSEFVALCNHGFATSTDQGVTWTYTPFYDISAVGTSSSFYSVSKINGKILLGGNSARLVSYSSAYNTKINYITPIGGTRVTSSGGVLSSSTPAVTTYNLLGCSSGLIFNVM